MGMSLATLRTCVHRFGKIKISVVFSSFSITFFISFSTPHFFPTGHTHFHSHLPLLLTAELGDFDPRKHSVGYVSHYRLVSKQTTDLEEQVTRLHQTLVGKRTAETEFQFLAYARR